MTTYANDIDRQRGRAATQYDETAGKYLTGRMLKEDGSTVVNLAEAVNADASLAVTETTRFFAMPVAVSLQFGPAVGYAATNAGTVVALSSLTSGRGMKPGTLLLNLYVATQHSRDGNNTVTVTGYADAAGTVPIAAIAKTIASTDAAGTLIGDALTAIQYCPYFKVAFTLGGATGAAGLVKVFIMAEGAEASAAVVA